MNKARMLVVHVSYTYGGAERSLRDIMTHSAASDRYLLALHPDSILFAQLKARGLDVRHEDVRYFRRKDLRKGIFRLGHLLAVSWRLKELCRRESVTTVCCNSHRSLIYMCCVRLWGYRVVCSCRDNVKTALERWLIRRMSQQTIAVSRHVGNRLRPLSRVHCLPNAVCEPLSIPGPGLRERYRIPAGGICIGMLSSVLRWKNQRDCVEIVLGLLQGSAGLLFSDRSGSRP